jgi:myo-inositol-1(or 4)-monophosphatase
MEEDVVTVAIDAAKEAGALLKAGFGGEIGSMSKAGRHDLVTEYDHKSERLISSIIHDHYPDHTIIGEEGGRQAGAEGSIEWIVDPLDGTVNYAYGLPMFAVSIAATHLGKVLAGVIYHPLIDELFVATKGKGATCNGKALRVSDTERLEDSIVAVGFPYNVAENPMRCLDHFTNLARVGAPIRRMGSAALDLAYVAAGRFDTFWEVSLRPWDYAAGMLLVEEAGGQCTNFGGERYTDFIEGPIAASNGHLHTQLLRHMNEN